MQTRNSRELVADLRRYLEENDLRQNTLIIGTGVKQYTVSRYLKEPPKKVSATLIKLCKYAKIEVSTEVEVAPQKSDVLMDALKSVWDGTPKHAKSIAAVIKSLSRYR